MPGISTGTGGRLRKTGATRRIVKVAPRGRTMAANLTPQYLEAESEYKKAPTAEERLACLRKMYSLLPKHKASEKLQAELKTKISEAREASETERTRKKGGVSYKIPRQGAGQVVLVGG